MNISPLLREQRTFLPNVVLPRKEARKPPGKGKVWQEGAAELGVTEVR